jgi:hypothetical protein
VSCRIVAGAFAVLVVATACSSGGKHSAEVTTAGPSAFAASHTQHADLSKYGLRFDYPKSWHLDAFDVNEHYIQIAAYVSNQRLTYPCTTTSDAVSASVSCGSPLARLDPDGVLVSWSTIGGPPGVNLARMPGRATTIDGHRAKVAKESPGNCAGVEAARTITAYILRDSLQSHDEMWSMNACLGPKALAAEPEVLRMLESVRL